MSRKYLLANGEVYHIFNKSIANFKIFNNKFDFKRMQEAIKYYRFEDASIRFVRFVSRRKKDKGDSIPSRQSDRLVDIISYCIMPTHLHLVLQQTKDKGISKFMSNVLNSYSRYFNIRHKRKGPLWEGRFKNILVKTDEQLIHLTRYIHLNPTSAGLVNKPNYWEFSSFNEYLEKTKTGSEICSYEHLLDINPNTYKKFVENRVVYQRELSKIKSLILE